MPKTWIEALESYSYPVILKDYKRRDEFPGFFLIEVQGDRCSTQLSLDLSLDNEIAIKNILRTISEGLNVRLDEKAKKWINE